MSVYHIYVSARGGQKKMRAISPALGVRQFIHKVIKLFCFSLFVHVCVCMRHGYI